jgi:hypothetical protein
MKIYAKRKGLAIRLEKHKFVQKLRKRLKFRLSKAVHQRVEPLLQRVGYDLCMQQMVGSVLFPLTVGRLGNQLEHHNAIARRLYA